METQLTLSPRAITLVEEHFRNRKKKRAIRLFVKLGGCGIRSFGIKLDKRGESDALFEIAGFQYIIDKQLLAQVQPIVVDSDGFGFRISGSGVAPHHGCGNCGFMCGDGNQCLGDCATCPHKCGHGRRALSRAHPAS